MRHGFLNSLKLSTFRVIILVLVAIFQSCNVTSSTSFVKIEEIEKPVQIDSVSLGYLINPFSMRIIGSYLVMANAGRDSIIDICSVPELKRISSGIRHGSGPDEIISPNLASLCGSNDTAYLMTGLSAVVAAIKIPGLDNVENKRFKLPSGWEYTQAIIPVTDDMSLMQRGTLPMDWALVTNCGDIKRILSCDIPQDVKSAVANDNFSQMQVRSSVGVVSQDGKHVAICYKCFPLIEIFDVNSEIVKYVDIDYEFKNNELWIINADCTEKSLYVNIHNPNDKDFTHSTILNVNWNGEIEAAYAIPCAVAAFCIDDKQKILYFTSVNSDKIYTLKLE